MWRFLQNNPGDGLTGLLRPVPSSCGRSLVERPLVPLLWYYSLASSQGSRDPTPEKEYWGVKFSNSTSGFSILPHRVFHTSGLNSEQGLSQHLPPQHTPAKICGIQTGGERPSVFGDLVPKYLWILKCSDAQVSCIKPQCKESTYIPW